MDIKCSTKRRRAINHNNNTAKQEDRLSSLPDPILVNILSLLSIDTAIAATLLSRQWLNLWTQVTSINIDVTSSEGPFTHWTSFEKHVLTKLTCSLIHKITLNLKCGDLNKYRSSVIDSWFRKIAGCWDIDEIHVTSNGLDGRNYFPSIFNVKSLVKLEIIGGFAWNLSDKEFYTEINLPNLKKLIIQIHLAQYNFLTHLMKSCTSLEDLSLILDETDKSSYFVSLVVVELSSSSLKRLMLRFPSRLQYRTNEVKIDTPRLEFLKLDSCRNFEMFDNVSKLSRLIEVDLSGSFVKGVFRPNLLNPITSTRSLSLGYPDQIGPYQVGDEKAKFVKLTRLRCIVPSSEEGFKNLLALLENCPVLEVLILSITASSVRKKMSCLMLLAHCCTSPMLTLKHVKVLEINFMSLESLNTPTLNLIKVLINIVHVNLERLTFKVSGDDPDLAESHKVEVYKNFLEWVRWNTNSRCQVQYLGRYFSMISTTSQRELRASKVANGKNDGG